MLGSTGSKYHVTLAEDKRTCQCMDFRIRRRDCKHIKLVLQQLGISASPGDWHQVRCSRSAARCSVGISRLQAHQADTAAAGYYCQPSIMAQSPKHFDFEMRHFWCAGGGQAVGWRHLSSQWQRRRGRRHSGGRRPVFWRRATHSGAQAEASSRKEDGQAACGANPRQAAEGFKARCIEGRHRQRRGGRRKALACKTWH